MDETVDVAVMEADIEALRLDVKDKDVVSEELMEELTEALILELLVSDLVAVEDSDNVTDAVMESLDVIEAVVVALLLMDVEEVVEGEMDGVTDSEIELDTLGVIVPLMVTLPLELAVVVMLFERVIEAVGDGEEVADELIVLDVVGVTELVTEGLIVLEPETEDDIDELKVREEVTDEEDVMVTVPLVDSDTDAVDEIEEDGLVLPVTYDDGEVLAVIDAVKLMLTLELAVALPVTVLLAEGLPLTLSVAIEVRVVVEV